MKYSWNIIHLKSYIIDKLTSLLVIKTQMSHVIFDILFSRNIVNIHMTVMVTVREMAMETVQL